MCVRVVDRARPAEWSRCQNSAHKMNREAKETIAALDDDDEHLL